MKFGSGLNNYSVHQPVSGQGNLVQVCRDDPFKVCPYLAESWEPSSDFSQWTFKVRDNVVWHDGTPFNAQSFKEMLDLIVFGYKDLAPDPEARGWGGKLIKSVEALDGNRVRINLTGSLPGYVGLLASPLNSVVYPPHLMKPQIDKGNVKVTPLELGMVGVGPFTFASYQKGSIITLRKFNQYWEKDKQGRRLPYLDGVDMPIITDREAGLAAFRTGRVDRAPWGAGFELLPGHIDLLQRQFGDKVSFLKMEANAGNVMFNTISPGPWQDARVRRAVSMAYDRQAYLDVYAPGEKPRALYERVSAYTNPDYLTWPGFNPSTRAQDLAAAKALLAEAGYPSGFQTTFLTRQEWTDFAEFSVAQFAKIGIVAKIEIVDVATFDQRKCKNSFEVASATSPEAAKRLAWAVRANFASFSANPCSVSAKHEDPKVDQLIERMEAAANNDKELVPLARQFERYLLLDQVYYIIGSEMRSFPYYSYVKGLLDPVSGSDNYHDHAWVWLDK